MSKNDHFQISLHSQIHGINETNMNKLLNAIKNKESELFRNELTSLIKVIFSTPTEELKAEILGLELGISVISNLSAA